MCIRDSLISPRARMRPMANPDGMSRGAWRMILLASLGGTLEYYDFVIFGIFAPQIGRAFFPSEDPLVSLMVTFTTFAIGYLARPLGGLVLGRLGDKVGRRGVFLASIFITLSLIHISEPTRLLSISYA